MATKWQILAVSSISIATLLFGLFTLAGMSVSDDGNKPCIDCCSEIKVNSTYWQINAESAGEDKTAVFRKSSAHVLYVNLDKVNEIVSTDPAIHTDIMLPAIKSTATKKDLQYGYLRPLKSGDSLIKRGYTNRVYVCGKKEAWQTVKWSFKVSDPLINDIDIDPVWLPSYNFSSSDYSLASAVTVSKICYTQTDYLPIYANITKSRVKYGEMTEYINKTFCSDFPINNSCSRILAFKYTKNIANGTENYIEQGVIGTTTLVRPICISSVSCGSGYSCIEDMDTISIINTNTSLLEWTIQKNVTGDTVK